MTALKEIPAQPLPKTLPALSELEGWQPSFGTDAELAQRAEAALKVYLQALEPAEKEEIAVGLHSALTMFTPPDNFQDLAKIYLKALENIPKDLLPQAVEGVLLRCKFFPKPCDFLEVVDKEIDRRKHLASLCRHYLWWFKKEKERKAGLKERTIYATQTPAA